MITCDVLRGILILLIPLFLYLGSGMFLVYLCVFLIYSSTRFFLPSKLAIIPELVSEERLLVANSLTATTRTFALMFSVAIAGVLVRLVGWRVSFYIDAVTYFISAVFISMISLKDVVEEVKRDMSVAKDVLKEAIRKHFIIEVKEGISYLLATKEIKRIVCIFFVLMSGVGALSAVLIVFIQKNFGTTTSHLGFFAGFLALGLLLGAVLYGKFGSLISKSKIIFSSFLLNGICLAVFAKIIAVHTSITAAAVMSLVLGLISAPIAIGLYTSLHQRLPHKLRGKIFSAVEIVIHTGFLVCMFLSAWIAEYTQEVWVMMAVGVLFAIWGVFGLMRYPVDIKKIT
jgi:MFS transporter, DHA3 family, macrolide efflux protein